MAKSRGFIPDWKEPHLGKEQIAVFRLLEKHFDPYNIMNLDEVLGLN